MAGGIKMPTAPIRPMAGAVLSGTIRHSGIILTPRAIWIPAGIWIQMEGGISFITYRMETRDICTPGGMRSLASGIISTKQQAVLRALW